MNRLRRRFWDSESFRLCFLMNWRLRFRFGVFRLGRFGGSDFFRFIAIETPECLLIQPLLESCDPATPLLRLRHGFARLRLASLLGFFRLFNVDQYSFRRRACSLSVGENVERFG